VLLTAASLTSEQAFVAVVEGFAALGTIVTVFSAALAYFALVAGDSAEKIGESVNRGIAYGFLPGVIVGTAVVVSSATTL
jgi:hypothetical protein